MPCASRVSVLFQKCVLPQRRIRSVAEFRQRFPEVKDVMIDGVGRPIQRPQSSKQQNRHYSGKKKSHRRKKVVMTDARRRVRVLVLMPSMPGRRHENLVDRSQASIPGEVGVIVDTGFQGVKVPPTYSSLIRRPRSARLTPKTGPATATSARNTSWWSTPP